MPVDPLHKRRSRAQADLVEWATKVIAEAAPGESLRLHLGFSILRRANATGAVVDRPTDRIQLSRRVVFLQAGRSEVGAAFSAAADPAGVLSLLRQLPASPAAGDQPISDVRSDFGQFLSELDQPTASNDKPDQPIWSSEQTGLAELADRISSTGPASPARTIFTAAEHTAILVSSNPPGVAVHRTRHGEVQAIVPGGPSQGISRSLGSFTEPGGLVDDIGLELSQLAGDGTASDERWLVLPPAVGARLVAILAPLCCRQPGSARLSAGTRWRLVDDPAIAGAPHAMRWDDRAQPVQRTELAGAGPAARSLAGLPQRLLGWRAAPVSWPANVHFETSDDSTWPGAVPTAGTAAVASLGRTGLHHYRSDAGIALLARLGGARNATVALGGPFPDWLAALRPVSGPRLWSGTDFSSGGSWLLLDTDALRR